MDTTPPTTDFVPNFKLLVVTDSAFKDLSSRHSQGAYAIFLGLSTNNDSVSGYAHLLQFNSRKSRRVVKSTWGAEMHALIAGLERAERLYYWLREIWQGFGHVPQGIRRVAVIENDSQHIA